MRTHRNAVAAICLTPDLVQLPKRFGVHLGLLAGLLLIATLSTATEFKPAARLILHPRFAAAQADVSNIRQLPLTTNDLIYNSTDHLIYASLPSSAGQSGNSIVAIDPSNAAIGTAVFIGSEPGKLALSDDGHTLYAGLGGAGAVRQFDTISQTAGQQFSLGNDSNPDTLTIWTFSPVIPAS